MVLRKQYELNKEINKILIHEALQVLLENDMFIFSSPFGIKNHRLTNKQKTKNQITKAEDVKVKSNYNIWTGYGNTADVDLDWPEARELADDLLNLAGVEFGRVAHAGRSHRVFRVLDLDKKKHTRNAYTFRDSDRENDIAEALRMMGGTRKRGCPVTGVGDNVNIWIIRNHDKYKNLTAKELGKLYKGFWIDSKAS